MKDKQIVRRTIDIQDGKTLRIKDMKITPFVIDHSSYNAMCFLIEVDGKKILHSGDIRRSWYKG